MDILSSFNFSQFSWIAFALVFFRIVIFLYFLPIFGEKVVSSHLRIGLSLVLSLFVYHFLSDKLLNDVSLLSMTYFHFFQIAFFEIFFCFCCSFSARFILFGVNIASQLVGVNMGFQASSMFSPINNEHESSFSILNNWLVILIIFTLDFHILFLKNIIDSFYFFPIGQHFLSSSFVAVSFMFMQDVFLFGLRLAAPIIVIQILLSLSLGLLNRTLPSLNVFIINFPISFLFTMVFLYLTMTSFLGVISRHGMEREVFWINSMFKSFSHFY